MATATQKALQSSDIVLEIFQHLKIYHKRQPNCENREALANCASVCKAFSSPALGVLWEVLDSVVPLFSLFSSFNAVQDDLRLDDSTQIVQLLTGLEDESTRPSIWTICGKTTREEWERFRQYAARVRVLNYRRRDNIDPSAFLLLYIDNNREPLLPFLRSFSWERASCLETGILATMAPSLRRIGLFYNDLPALPVEWSVTKRDHILQTLLEEFAAELPLLDAFELRGQIHSRFLKPIAQMRCLHTLDLYKIVTPYGDEDRLLDAISKMETLCVLKISHRLQAVFVDDSVCFPALRSLTIYGGFLNAAPLLAAISSQSFREFHVQQATLPHYMENELVVKALAKFSPSLRVLDMKFIGTDASWTDGEASPTLRMALGLVLDLPQIEHFAWDWIHSTHRMIVTTDEDLQAIGVAWPTLVSLSLQGMDSSDTFPTMFGLEALLRSCPNLKDLALPGILETRDSASESIAQNFAHGLRTLVVEQRRRVIEDPVRLARELDILLPDLDTASSSRPFVDKMGDVILDHPWNDVMGLLAERQQMRRQAKCEHASSSRNHS